MIIEQIIEKYSSKLKAVNECLHLNSKTREKLKDFGSEEAKQMIQDSDNEEERLIDKKNILEEIISDIQILSFETPLKTIKEE